MAVINGADDDNRSSVLGGARRANTARRASPLAFGLTPCRSGSRPSSALNQAVSEIYWL